jgi:Flp pilus assembly protein TadG
MSAGLACFMRRFSRDTRGVSAVEFALVLPLMLTLYLGSFEISQAISASRKVTLVSRTVADISSQSASLSSASMTNILNAASVIVAPFSVSNLKVTVTCVTIDSSSRATTTWSDTLNGTTHGVGSAVTLPSALNVASTSMVWSEVSYTYAPLFGSGLIAAWTGIGGTINLKDQMYMRPRLSDNCPSRTA